MNKSFSDFIKLVELKGKKKKPTRTKTKIRGTLLEQRNWRVSVREAALRGTTCIILYKKSTTGEVKRYEVIPTEYAYHRMKGGVMRRILWVQDVRDEKNKRQIKMFLCRNIIKAVPTDRKLKPKWPILII